MDQNNIFQVERLIRFADCDPAGIVYYPNYFNMFQSLVEDWFNQALGIDYADYIGRRQLGLPSVKVECEFLRPCRFGDTLALALQIDRIGRTSFGYIATGRVGTEEHLRGRGVIVTTSLTTLRPIPIPEDLMKRLQVYRESIDSVAASR
ncbi:MAG: acyl-CoA thioesterase [Betaproteobacteria bacterium]|nr:acyl-CoA thioesterase [Betaproteobacteria bacterium]